MSRTSYPLAAGPNGALAVTDLEISYTTDNPNITANGTIAIADGDAVAGLAEVATELVTRVNALTEIMRSHGLIQR
jgi:hypothetical protein